MHKRDYAKKALIICLLGLIILVAMSCQFSSASRLLPYRVSSDQTGNELKNSISNGNATTELEPDMSTDEIVTARVTATSKYIRTGPGGDFSGGGFLYKDDVVTIFAKSIDGYWFLIDRSKPSWIYNEHIELNGDLDKVPIFDQGILYESISTEEKNDENPGNEEQSADNLEFLTLEELISNDELITPNIHVSELSVFEQISGGLDVYGEITNIGNKPIKNVKVSIIFEKSNSKELLRAYALVLIPWQPSLSHAGVIFPGEKVPFGAHIQGIDKSQSLYVSVESETSDNSNDLTYTDLFLSSEKGEIVKEHPYTFEISGAIRNDGNANIRSIWIVAILYNTEGKVVGMEETITDSNLLKPSEDKNFLMRLTSRSDVESYALIFHAIDETLANQ